MKKIDFNNDLVRDVSNFLQDYMVKNNIDTLTADECAELLNSNNILSNEFGPKKGFNFRQMLRDGRDKKVNLVDGAFQERPNTKWFLNKIIR